jgi:hypothetical protein
MNPAKVLAHLERSGVTEIALPSDVVRAVLDDPGFDLAEPGASRTSARASGRRWWTGPGNTG